MKILVTGKNGQLASELQELTEKYKAHKFIFIGRNEMDFLCPELFFEILNIYKPELIVNTAAYTEVDKAENNKENCYKINVLAVEALVNWVKENNSKLIHISTDYVFDGTSINPYTEKDKTNPINVYGKSKLLSEKIILEANCQAIILRTSWLYSAYGKNFVKTMRSLLSEKEQISVVQDQIGNPTYAKDLVHVILNIINAPEFVSGVYHFSNSGKISWFEFAQKIKDFSSLNCTILPVSSSEFPTIAQRPKYSVLDTCKIENTFGVVISNWQISLKKMLTNYEQKL